MSATPLDEAEVNQWLRDKGLRHTIRELEYDPTLCRDCGLELLNLFRLPCSLHVTPHIVEALFARPLARAQKQEAMDLLLAFVRENAERYGTLEHLIDDLLPKHIRRDKVHEIGAMILDPRYGPLRHGMADVLRKIGNAEAISYLERAARDPLTANSSLTALARLRTDSALPLCEASLKLPKVLYRDEIQRTYAKLRRRLARHERTPSHVTKKLIPDGIGDWSANLDGDELPRVLRSIKESVQGGFAKSEISEVISAADDLSVNQEVRLRFPVQFMGQAADLWLELLCDDEDAFDLAVFGPRGLVEKIESYEAS